MRTVPRLLVPFLLAIAPIAALEVGAEAPALEIRTTHNPPGDVALELGALHGRVVLIDFWATWCGPCITAIPHVQELHERYADRGLVVIGHTDGSSRDLESFIEKKGITYSITVGPDIGNDYDVRGIPHVYIIGVDGRVAWHGHPARLSDEIVERELERVDLTALGGGPSGPTVELEPTDRKVARAVERIGELQIGGAIHSLERIAEGEDDAAAEAAVVITAVEEWLAAREQEIRALLEEGDAYGAYELADQIEDMLSGHDSRETFHQLVRECRGHDEYRIGRRYRSLLERIDGARGEAKKTAVERFVERYPESHYAERARELIAE